jgi:ABC-type sugar transport system ATPase subunit
MNYTLRALACPLWLKAFHLSATIRLHERDFHSMALISLQDVSIGFGGPLLLDEINLQIESGEWVGLLGRNGMGKSTLLKLIAGELLPHSGTITYQRNISVAYLP